MPSLPSVTDEEQAAADTNKEGQLKQDEGHRENLTSMKSHILKKSRDSYLLIPLKKTRLTLDDVLNFLKNF